MSIGASDGTMRRATVRGALQRKHDPGLPGRGSLPPGSNFPKRRSLIRDLLTGDEPRRPLPRRSPFDRKDWPMNARTKPRRIHRLPRRRHRARPLGPPRDRHRRNRDARPHGHPRGVRRDAAPQGRAHHRLAPHDHPDRRPDRDAQGARAPRCAGPRATSSRPRTTPPPPSPPPAFPCSPTRASRSPSTGTTPTRSSSGPTAAHSNMILDDGGDATLLLHLGARAEKDIHVLDKPTSEEERVLFAAIKKRLAAQPGWYAKRLAADQGRHRGDHHRRPPPLPDAQARRAEVPRHQRQRLGHQVASSTTCTAAASRWWTASSAPPT